jgi:hypothetical protein
VADGVGEGDEPGIVGHRIKAIPIMAKITTATLIWGVFQGRSLTSLTLVNQNSDGIML